MTDPQSPELDAGPIPRAGQRVLSGVLDLGLVILGLFAIVIISTIFIKAGPGGTYTAEQRRDAGLIQSAGLLLIGLLLFVIPQRRTGRTVGKFLLRTRIVLADSSNPGWGPLLIKYGLMFGLLAVPLYPVSPMVALLGWLYSLFNPRRRSLFDLAAGTYVVADTKLGTDLGED